MNGPDPSPGERPERTVIDRAVLAERRARRAELGEQMQARRAAEADTLAGELSSALSRMERELESAREAPARAEAELAEHERARRAAEQQAYAERRAGAEIAEEAAQRVRAAETEASRARERAHAARRVARELAQDVVRLRRRVAEAEHAAAAAGARRRRSTAGAASSAQTPGAEWVVFRASGPVLALERPIPAAPDRASAARLLAAEGRTRTSAESGASAGAERLLAQARSLAEEVATRLAEARGASERDASDLHRVRAGWAQAEEALRAERTLTARAHAAVAELRAELAALATPAPPAPAPAAPPDPELTELADRAAALAVSAKPSEAEPIADRLEAARVRLREAARREEELHAASSPAEATPESEPASRASDPGVVPWLPRAFARLAAEEPAVAGDVLLGLLPALAGVVERPTAFEFTLPDAGRLLVRAAPGRTSVESIGARAKRGAIDFRLRADLAALGAFAAAEGVGRIRAPARVRLRGRRAHAAVLQGLVRASFTLTGLAELGVDLGPELAYRLLARGVEPAWTAGHAFTILHETTGLGGSRAWVSVGDGQPLAVSGSPPAGPVAASVSCRRGALLPVLAGAPLPGGEHAALGGDPAAFALLQGWLARAQS